MARYLLEVSHEAERIACAKAVQLLLQMGSHFVSQADFGCLDGVHRAWIIVESDSKDEALNMVPPAYRDRTTVIGLNKFTLAQIDQLLRSHA